MAGAKTSKNNPNSRKSSVKSKMVTSIDCENCNERCAKGNAYLARFAIKKHGNGVMCFK